MKKNLKIITMIFCIGVCYIINQFGLINPFYLQIIQYIGIYSIAVLGINLVNGYLGDFSLGHAGFMAIGAYISAISSIYLFKSPILFPLCILIGGFAALLSGFVVAIPSFKVRGDYLAIITLGFGLIVKSLFENIAVLGGPRGLRGIPANTNIMWVFIWVVIAVIAVKRFMNSKYGRSTFAIHSDEVASSLVSINTKKTKFIVFGFSAFLLGVSGGLLGHLLSFINPNTFGYSMITEGLIMVYLGGIASISGSLLGAGIWCLLVEILRPLGIWRWIVGALLLITLMIFKPTGLMGYKEFSVQGLKSFFQKIKRLKHEK